MTSKKERGIIPRKIKGFRDIDATLNQLKQRIIEQAGKVYKSYGFEHWDTPVLEYADALGKYMPDDDTVDKGVYAFNNPEIEPVFDTQGEFLRDDSNEVVMENQFLALRYDLTAPLARHYAEKLWTGFLKGQVKEGKAPLFRRFQYGPVYRYEIKLAPGRFREFWQLDFDTVGTDSMAADAEACMILSDALKAIGLKEDTYRVKVNNRKVLKGFLASLDVENEENEQAILRIIDKYDKIGLKGVKEELGGGRTDKSGAKVVGLNLDNVLAEAIFTFLNEFIKGEKGRKEILQNLKKIDHPLAQEGVQELEEIDEILTKLNFGNDRICFDPTLVRGMAYYTGPIFEVESLQTYRDRKGQKRQIGAICGGGRYDGLVEQMLGMSVPAVGASIGVDRLAELLVLTNQAPEKVDGPILIANFDNELMPDYQLIAKDLRAVGCEVEIYYGCHTGFRGLKKQLTYADRKNCPIAILIGSDEAEKGVATVRNLKLGKELASSITDKKEWRNRVQKELRREQLVAYILEIL